MLHVGEGLGRTLDQVGDLGVDEFAQWIVHLDEQQALEREVMDWRFARLCCVVANLLGGETQPSDFMPRAPISMEQAQKALMLHAAACGKVVQSPRSKVQGR